MSRIWRAVKKPVSLGTQYFYLVIFKNGKWSNKMANGTTTWFGLHTKWILSFHYVKNVCLKISLKYLSWWSQRQELKRGSGQICEGSFCGDKYIIYIFI